MSDLYDASDLEWEDGSENSFSADSINDVEEGVIPARRLSGTQYEVLSKEQLSAAQVCRQNTDC